MDDTNILYAGKCLKSLEQTADAELINLHGSLTTNKLTLNTETSNLVIFCPRQE